MTDGCYWNCFRKKLCSDQSSYNNFISQKKSLSILKGAYKRTQKCGNIPWGPLKTKFIPNRIPQKRGDSQYCKIASWATIFNYPLSRAKQSPLSQKKILTRNNNNKKILWQVYTKNKEHSFLNLFYLPVRAGNLQILSSIDEILDR